MVTITNAPNASIYSDGVLMEKEKLGLVHIYTGNGKGKTTAALGLAMRALGHGYKILIIQFMKGRTYGELKTVNKLRNIKIIQFGTDEFIYKNNLKKIDISLAKKGLRYAKKALKNSKYNMVILDEINVAIDYGLVNVDNIVLLIKNKRKDIELVLTGRNAPKKILELADLITEMREIKHYYKRGIISRKGIEW